MKPASSYQIISPSCWSIHRIISDDKIITNYHCQNIAQKIQGSADLPFECSQIKLPTPPTSGNLQQKMTVAASPAVATAKPAVVSPFEGLRGGPGRVYHAQVQRRLTSTRRFSKD